MIDDVPAPIVGVTDAVSVTAATDNCVLRADATVACWGYGTFNPVQPTPTAFPLVGVQQLVAGESHVCALLSGGTVLCWGYNGTGALGVGMGVESSAMPAPVPGLSSIVSIAAGYASTCAVREDREVFCWGYNPPGDGTSMPSYMPAKVAWSAPSRRRYGAQVLVENHRSFTSGAAGAPGREIKRISPAGRERRTQLGRPAVDVVDQGGIVEGVGRSRARRRPDVGLPSLRWKSIVRPSGVRFAPPSAKAELSVPRLVGVPKAAALSGRATSQMSRPPLPPGRSELT